MRCGVGRKRAVCGGVAGGSVMPLRNPVTLPVCTGLLVLPCRTIHGERPHSVGGHRELHARAALGIQSRHEPESDRPRCAPQCTSRCLRPGGVTTTRASATATGNCPGEAHCVPPNGAPVHTAEWFAEPVRACLCLACVLASVLGVGSRV